MGLPCKLAGLVTAIVVLFLAGQTTRVWIGAMQARSEAEARVEAAVEKGATVISLRDMTALRSLPRNLSEVDRLTRLDARGTSISDISAVAGRAALEFIDVGGTRVSDLSPLAGLPNLRHVVIGGSRVGDLEPLATLPALERLGMHSVQALSLEPLTRAPKLNWINLHAAYAVDGSLTHYERLQETVPEVNNGRAFRMNYVPDDSWLWRVRMNRLAGDFGLPEPFPR